MYVYFLEHVGHSTFRFRLSLECPSSMDRGQTPTLILRVFVSLAAACTVPQ